MTSLFDHLKVNPRKCGLILTEPSFNFESIRAEVEDLVFDDFGFKSLLTVPAAELAIRNRANSESSLAATRACVGLVIDAGFSFTTVIPVFDGKVVTWL